MCRSSLRDTFSHLYSIFSHIKVRDRNRQSKTCFFFIIGVTVRLQSRDIQVIDSDTHLCTQLFTLKRSNTFRTGRNMLKGQHAIKSMFTSLVDGVQFFYYQYYGPVILSHPCMFYTGNHITDGTSYTTYHQSNKTTA